MAKKNKLEQEFQEEEQPDSEVFSVSFNPNNEKHRRIVSFLAKKSREQGMTAITSDRRMARFSGATFADMSEKKDDDKDDEDSGFIMGG